MDAIGHYYNEIDPYAAAWLRELGGQGLILAGEVDERSICDVRGGDLVRYVQCHLFAGIGGWAEALRLAGWPAGRGVWTGSCPCQPFSCAGRQRGETDARHLWPELFRLIRECRPDTVFGEQVANAIGHDWLDGISTDLEREGYAVGACVLGAHSVGAPHRRQRLFWVADADGREPRDGKIQRCGEYRCVEKNGATVDGMGHPAHRRRSVGGDDHDSAERGHGPIRDSRIVGGLSDASGAGSFPGAYGGIHYGEKIPGAWDEQPERSGTAGGLGAPGARLAGDGGDGRESGRIDARPAGHGASAGAWGDYRVVPCADGKARRIESGLEPLAHGVPARVVRLRGYGNAIVPQLAAEFIRAYMSSRAKINNGG